MGRSSSWISDWPNCCDLERDDPDDLTHTVAHTVVGAVLGSPGYMSPEQEAGKALDIPSDVFSFGIVLHELLSGVRASQ